jgi:hypothetical protein
MAGTDDDINTSDDQWWFLSPKLSRLANPELAFVAQHTGDEDAAKEFLWDGVLDKSIRWYAEIEIHEDGDPVFRARAGLVTSIIAVDRGLWHRDYFGMNWKASRGIYTGPTIRLQRDPNGSEHLIYDGRATVRIIARLMRFHHGDVMHRLRYRGLMPWPLVQIPISGVQAEGVAESVRVEVITTPSASPSVPSARQESPQSEASERESQSQPSKSKVILKAWLPGAVKDWPPDATDTGALTYTEFLQSKAPKNWSVKSIHNELSRLRKIESGMDKLSKPKNFGKRRS